MLCNVTKSAIVLKAQGLGQFVDLRFVHLDVNAENQDSVVVLWVRLVLLSHNEGN